jgi:hypothetical protein
MPGTMVVDTDSSIRIRIQDFEDKKREHPAIQKIKFTNFFSIFVSLFCSPGPGWIRNTAGKWIILPHSSSS